MDSKCPFGAPCDRVIDMINRVAKLEDASETTEKRLAEGDKKFAVINIKLNCLIAILSAIGSAVLGFAIKMLFGG